MIVEFPYEQDTISCLISFKDEKQEFLGISSALLLNNMLKIDVELINQPLNLHLPNLSQLNSKRFTIKTLHSR